ncbi:nucleoside recognition GATE domain-containing membrane protein YjiH [Dethiosulfatibacter aminovorans DSM 17477]|uniref:Nucleoside recognition GATE domain-containing membrane protein YjiH n=1 Tax=Dethiosulfatibacter aminovorans DSM 17477 TaxID=1121476 RepID=A0A1M6F094_9FIRM|nr:nucleoside recognition domain-containing protein [Dethiosulfatibacter aminovorans]SHI91103.1 nucleoside recognition GATE domain-containing membrane protein YjiH [Dethiosulfatibacter aminovorans DSM 17477]
MELKNSRSSYNSATIIKAILLSAIGVIFFFVPVIDNTIPMVYLSGLLIGILKPFEYQIATYYSVLLFATSMVYKVMGDNAPALIKKHHEKDNPVTVGLYFLAALFGLMVTYNFGPSQILDGDVGGLSVHVAFTTIFRLIVAGAFVIFLTEFGFIDFLGTLLEPIMRRAYKIPGYSAIDALASFVSVPAVGVYITNSLYKDGKYTAKEACSITTNFSVCSIAFFALMVSVGEVDELFPHVLITSLIVTFLIAIITIRIPPLSKKKNEFFDGRVQTEEQRSSSRYSWGIFKKATDAGISKAENTDLGMFKSNLIDSVMFSQKICSYVISVAVLALLLAEYTPIFDYMGMPFVPLLNLVQLPNVDIIAPAAVIGISEILLPVLIITGKGVATISMFFIIVLSSVQIIFFTESANAMLESDMPLSLIDLVAIFFVRTIIAIPLVAIAAHILF